jgi:hypothetical protein
LKVCAIRVSPVRADAKHRNTEPANPYPNGIEHLFNARLRQFSARCLYTRECSWKRCLYPIDKHRELVCDPAMAIRRKVQIGQVSLKTR